MVKIVNGAIVPDNAPTNNESNSTAPSSSDVVIFGQVVPQWSILVVIAVAYFLGGFPAAAMAGIILGVGYYRSQPNSTASSQPSSGASQGS
mmetsp:Transcript_4055/g.6287  ORF Transcript_4055/g.6287 Transcript_4055/m.6287 type:complete len:91 (-) Transcript_4055:352-624(-)